MSRVGGVGWEWMGVGWSGWEHGLVKLFAKKGTNKYFKDTSSICW